MTEDESMVKIDHCLRLFSSRRQPPLLVHTQFFSRVRQTLKPVMSLGGSVVWPVLDKGMNRQHKRRPVNWKANEEENY